MTDTISMTAARSLEKAFKEVEIEAADGMLFIHAIIEGQTSSNLAIADYDDAPMTAHAVLVGPFVLIAISSDLVHHIVKVRPGNELTSDSELSSGGKLGADKVGFTVLVQDGGLAELRDFAVNEGFVELIAQAAAFDHEAGSDKPFDREYEAVIAREWDFNAIVAQAEVVFESRCVTDMSA